MKNLIFLIVAIFTFSSVVFGAERVTLQGGNDQEIGTAANPLNVNLQGAITADANGDLTFSGTGATSTESFTYSFGDLSNIIEIDSATGAQFLSSLIWRFKDDVALAWGDSYDMFATFETTGNDNMQLGVEVGSASRSGYVSLMEGADMGDADRSPSGTSADPVFRIYSSDDTNADDYLDLYHNQTDAYITQGTGSLYLGTPVGSDWFLYRNGDNTGISFPGSGDRIQWVIGGSGFLDARNTSQDYVYFNNAQRDVDVAFYSNSGFTLFSNGDTDNVGIGGETDPQSKLEINGDLGLVDGMSAPSATVGTAKIYVDSADGDLKIKFGDGTTKTIATDT